VQSEVFFEEDREEQRQDNSEEEREVIDDLLDASMNVSTGALLTQDHSAVEKEVVVEVVEVVEITETVVEQEEGEEIVNDEEDELMEEQTNMPSSEREGDEIDTRKFEEMEGIEQSEVPASQQQESENSEEPEAVEMEAVEVEVEAVEVETAEVEMVEVETVEVSVEVTETVAPVVENVSQAPGVDSPAQPQQRTTQSESILSTTQDESTTTQYPASTPSMQVDSAQESLPTQDDPRASQVPPSEPTQITPVIPATQPPVTLPPPSYFPARELSPPKPPHATPISAPTATPQPPVPPSGQIQVQETPFAAQKFHKEILFTSSNTHISATAPAALSPEKAIDEETKAVPKHRRDRHVGPVVPKFSRREKKATYYLEDMLVDDLKKFYGPEWKPVRRRTPTPRSSRSPRQLTTVPRRTPTPRLTPSRLTPLRKSTPQRRTPQQRTPVPVDKDEPMEEVTQERYEEDLSVKEKLRSPFMDIDHPSSQPSRRVAPNPPEIPSSPTQSQSNEPAHETQPRYRTQLSPEIPSTQDDSQLFDATNSRWGRFATHWRRFSTT